MEEYMTSKERGYSEETNRLLMRNKNVGKQKLARL
jgi:hypothetical protein